MSQNNPQSGFGGLMNQLFNRGNQAALAQYGTFYGPNGLQESGMDKFLNGLGYAADFMKGASSAPEGAPPLIYGIDAALDRHNIRTFNKQQAEIQQAKRQELSKWAGAMPQDVIQYVEDQAGLPRGTLNFGSQTYLDPKQIGDIQFNLGGVRQMNMNRTPMYGPLAPSAQTGPIQQRNLAQKAKAANFLPFQQNPAMVFGAGADAQNALQPVPQMQLRTPNPGFIPPMQAPQTPSLGPTMQSAGFGNRVPMADPTGMTGVQQRNPYPPTPQPLQAGTTVVQPAPDSQYDLDPFSQPTDFPNNVTRIFQSGAQGMQRQQQHELQAERISNQHEVQQAQVKKYNADIKKLEEETRWLGPKAKAYITNMTRPRGGGGRPHTPGKMEVAEQMLKHGDITPAEYKEAKKRFIGLGKNGGASDILGLEEDPALSNGGGSVQPGRRLTRNDFMDIASGKRAGGRR